MQTYVLLDGPRSRLPAPLLEGAEREGQTGSANATCATTPPSKKESARLRVRSMNWSGITRVPGGLLLPEAPDRGTDPIGHSRAS